MPKMKKVPYPMTRTQEETCERKGWIKTSTGWKKPKYFNEHDQARIDRAELRRQARGVGAD